MSGLHFAACFFMTGVISVIQLIHYPCFAEIEPGKFAQFHARHSRALGWIAGPAMCVELATAIWLVKSGHAGWMLNLAAVAALWLITFGVSVPAHNRLATGFDLSAWQRLCRTNWLRSALWGARSLVFACVLTLP